MHCYSCHDTDCSVSCNLHQSYNNPNQKSNIKCNCNETLFMKVLASDGLINPADNNAPPIQPPWLDLLLYRRGRQMFLRNFICVFIGHLVGLIAILAEIRILKVLTHTDKSSTPQTAFKRYLSTLTHVRQWYSSDLWKIHESGHKSIMSVRKLHSKSHKGAEQAKVILLTSQYDMVITQWAFVGPVVLFTKQLGIKATDEGLMGFIHFWRVVGYLLGIDDRFNLCSGNLNKCREDCLAIFHVILKPALYNSPQDFNKMKDALLSASKQIVPLIDPDAFWMFTCDLLEGPTDDITISRQSLQMFSFQKNFHCNYLFIPLLGDVLRIIFNHLLALDLYLLRNIVPTVIKWKQVISQLITNIFHIFHMWCCNLTKAIIALFHLPS